jgi:arylformamidase
MNIIDISQPLFACGVYPGDAEPGFTRVRQMPEDPYNLTEISLCVHNGTHIDAPRHFIADGPGVGLLPLDVFFGACTVTEWNGDIAPILACCAERLLLMGGTDITPEAAQAIARSHVRLVGVESQSAGSADAPEAVHQILLGSGVVLLEGLAMSQVAPGSYILSAFPLNLGAECDGSPVRAVLINGTVPKALFPPCFHRYSQ